MAAWLAPLHRAREKKRLSWSQPISKFRRFFFLYLYLSFIGLIIPIFITKDFPPLYSEYESFYTRNLYTRLSDCFNRPVASVPGPIISILERVSDDYNWTFRQTGRKIEALNLGSYNYLGFAESSGKCADDSIGAIKRDSVATCSPRQELGI